MTSVDEEEQDQRTPLSISNTSGASTSLHEVLLRGVQDEESDGMLEEQQDERQDRPSSLPFSNVHANMAESSPEPRSTRVKNGMMNTSTASKKIPKRLVSAATDRRKSVSFGATGKKDEAEVEGSYVSKGSLVSSALSYSAAGSAKDGSAAAGSFANSMMSYEFSNAGNTSYNGSRTSAGYQSQTFDFPDEVSGESEQVSLLRGQYDAQIKALEEKFDEKYRTLEARMGNFGKKIPRTGSNASSMITDDTMGSISQMPVEKKKGKFRRAESSILQVFSANGTGDPTDMPLEQDTFLLMMISKACSKAWVLGLTNVAFQITLGIMILIDQIGAGNSSSDFNIPFTVKNEVRVGQFLTILLCLVTQRDVLTSIQTFIILNKDSDWDKIIGEEGNKNPLLRFQRVIFPNLLKLLEGLLVMFTTMIIVMQGNNIIELIKGLTALMIISRTDNILFMLADYGFLGQDLQGKTIEAKEIDMQANNDKEKAAATLKKSYTLRSLALLFLSVVSIGWWIYVIINQVTGTYFNEQFPHCKDHFELALEHFGDGECYGGPLNTFECGFEGGDCINFNFAYPLCKGDDWLINVEREVGNDVCNKDFATIACDFDGGDCCPANITKSPSFGDGQCNGGLYSTRLCGFDDGDCNALHRDYPGCPLDKLSEISGSENIILGNSICEGTIYSNATCGYEAGDCDVGQVGQDVRFGGISSGTALFSRMRMSADGSTVVVGQYHTQPDAIYNATASGLVQLYSNNSTDNLWKRKGNIIAGEGSGDDFGQSLAANFDGSIVAVGGSQNDGGGTNSGHVKVFQFNSSEATWIQYGQTIKGQESNELSGIHIDMTSDGSRVAIAAPKAGRTGKIRIYSMDADQQLWVQVGADINGKRDNDDIGNWYLHLNSMDGSRVIFSVGHGFQGKIGKTRVYEFDEKQQEWNKLGYADINSDYFKAVATSADGNRLAISFVPFSPLGNTKGRVEIYDWSIDSWTKMTTLKAISSADGDGFGNSISFSSDGNLLVVGTLKSACAGESNPLCAAGSVELFRYDELTNFPDEPYARVPKKVSNRFGNIVVESERVLDNYMIGVQVSLSSDGSMLSIGGYDISRDAGFFKVYEVDKLFYQNCVVRYPEWVGDSNCNDHEPFYSEKCGYDGGDCRPPRAVEGYPECVVTHPGNIGNDMCDDYLPYNSEKCGYDGGDCPTPQAANDNVYSNCFVSYPEKLGDGECYDKPPYDTYECGFDHGDCLPDYMSPTLSPTFSLAPSISAAPTLPPKPTAWPTTEESAVNVVFELLTDAYPHENRWELVDDATDTVVKSKEEPEYPLVDNTFYSEHFTLQHCVYYTLTMYDEYGDGIISGYFKVFVEGERVKGFSNGSDFGSNDSVTIYNC